MADTSELWRPVQPGEESDGLLVFDENGLPDAADWPSRYMKRVPDGAVERGAKAAYEAEHTAPYFSRWDDAPEVVRTRWLTKFGGWLAAAVGGEEQ